MSERDIALTDASVLLACKLDRLTDAQGFSEKETEAVTKHMRFVRENLWKAAVESVSFYRTMLRFAMRNARNTKKYKDFLKARVNLAAANLANLAQAG